MFSGGLKFSDDEDDFVVTVGSSNLSNIFGVSPNISSEPENRSLKYVPPKQTKSNENLTKQEKTTSGWSVQIAKLVTAFKLSNQENIPQGKIGFAILKNPEDIYRIILYRSKNNVLSTTTLKEDRKLFLKSQYLQFHDDLQIFWSVLFQDDDLEETIKLVKDKVMDENLEQSPIISNQLSELNKQEISTDDVNTIPKEENNNNNGSSDEKVKETKASILSRMAKMGQPLPKLASITTTDMSDSSDTEVRNKIIPKVSVCPRKPKPPQLVAVPQSCSQIVTPVFSGIAPINNSISQDAQFISMLMSENRTQNTEIRMNISKLETKLERVLDKIDTFKSVNNKHEINEDQILELEEKVLELKKENRSLKTKIREFDKESNNHDFSEFNNLTELFQIHQDDYKNNYDFCKDLILRLDTEVKTLKSDINSKETILNELQSNFHKLEIEKNEKIHNFEEEILKLQQQLKEFQEEIKTINLDKTNLSEELKLTKLESTTNINDKIKIIMCNLYETLAQHFTSADNFQSNDILRFCANTIKKETNNIIK